MAEFRNRRRDAVRQQPFLTLARYNEWKPVDKVNRVQAFEGKAFVVRVDEATAFAAQTTFFDDLAFLVQRRVFPILVAPDAKSGRSIVRTINRAGNRAVALSGSDAGMLPAATRGVGSVQTGILQTLTGAGYIPVIEPTAYAAFQESDCEVAADEVARAIAAATDAVRAMFFHALGGVPDPQTEALIAELTPAEALAIAGDARIPADLRAAVRAAALGVRGGVGAAQIVDGRIAHAAIVELLTAHHLGTQVTGGVFTGAA